VRNQLHDLFPHRTMRFSKSVKLKANFAILDYNQQEQAKQDHYLDVILLKIFLKIHFSKNYVQAKIVIIFKNSFFF